MDNCMNLLRAMSPNDEERLLDPAWINLNDQMHVDIDICINYTNIHWRDLLQWTKENEWYKEEVNGSDEDGTAVLKHVNINSIYFA